MFRFLVDSYELPASETDVVPRLFEMVLLIIVVD
jgi:hypothetical protein